MERKKLIEKANLCTNCLGASHTWKQCKSQRTCKSCNQKHHSLIHASFNKPAPPTERKSTHNTNSKSSPLIKPTAVVTIYNSQEQGVSSRVLIDNCSDACFIQESFVNELGLEKEKLPVPLTIEALQGITVSTVKHYVNVDITSRYYPQLQRNVKAYVIKKIGGIYPPQQLDSSKWNHLPEHGLADPEFATPRQVELLLSTDVYFDIIRNGLIRGKQGEPVAQESGFGWLIGGGSSTDQSSQVNCKLTNSIDSILQKFWTMEHGPAEQPALTKEEQQCEQHYTTTTTRFPNGAYQVELPFKNSSPSLGNSKAMAIKRFHNLESKFTRNPEFGTRYRQAIAELLQDDHLELIPNCDMQKPATEVYYLPHHAVLKESSKTTKIRIVYDASSKTSNQQSLNDQLLVGPVIQDDLTSILISWRFWKVALSADIKQMYLQIHIHPNHRDYLRIFWRPEPNESIKSYRMKKVTFGTASAPFQAIRTLHQLAKHDGQQFPQATEVLKRDFYVDDVLTGTNTTEEAVHLQQQLVTLTSKAQFTLRKWTSSDPAVLASIPDHLRESSTSLNMDKEEQTKALELNWTPSRDEFTFKVKIPNTLAITKRKILSEIAKVFDPLGFLSPVTIRSKLIMQGIWKCTTGWDEKVPEPLLSAWNSYQTELQQISEIHIPRWISLSDPLFHQLHGFADASERGFASSVYMRTVTPTAVKVQLIICKTRIAQTKEINLARMELCAAALLATLMSSVKTALQIMNAEAIAWSDSTITLAWIKTDPQKLKTFIRNRVITITEHIPATQWYHVPGSVNPADLPSRGIHVADLINNKLWWSGPDFLQSREKCPFPLS